MKGKLVVDELILLGLSQMEIERRSGVDQTTVSCLHRGSRKRTSYENVIALEALLRKEKASRRNSVTRSLRGNNAVSASAHKGAQK